MKLSFYSTIEIFINWIHIIYQNLFYISLFILLYIVIVLLFILPFEKIIKRKTINEKRPYEIYLLNSIGKN